MAGGKGGTSAAAITAELDFACGISNPPPGPLKFGGFWK
jgi:hypothetical protein